MTKDIQPAKINAARDDIAGNSKLLAKITEQINARIEKQVCQAYLKPQLNGMDFDKLSMHENPKAEIGRMFSPLPGGKGGPHVLG